MWVSTRIGSLIGTRVYLALFAFWKFWVNIMILSNRHNGWLIADASFGIVYLILAVILRPLLTRTRVVFVIGVLLAGLTLDIVVLMFSFSSVNIGTAIGVLLFDVFGAWIIFFNAITIARAPYSNAPVKH